MMAFIFQHDANRGNKQSKGRIYRLLVCIALLLTAGVANISPAAAADGPCTLSPTGLIPVLGGGVKFSLADPAGTVYQEQSRSLPFTVECKNNRPAYLILNVPSTGTDTYKYYTVSGQTVTYLPYNSIWSMSPSAVSYELTMQSTICRQQIAFDDWKKCTPYANYATAVITPPANTSANNPYRTMVYVPVTARMLRSAYSTVFPKSHPTSEDLLKVSLIGEPTPGVFGISYATLTTKSLYLVTKGCVVTTPSATVNLGVIRVSDFKGKGTVLAEKPFTLGFNCDPSVKVSMTLSGKADSTESSALALMSKLQGDATGVAVQILAGGKVMTPNATTATAVITNAVQGINEVKMSARYYQTAATVTEGEANVVATLIIDYE
ncbi:fimbrial protein [Enterobacillus tribolii]|uniref:Type 1 fimbria pilin n=1 Tax=Enterobacillus tribolii TaxID=1487935 RepID=A0A370QNW9_9GAMM|nr:fimbrial protein [Enterobacillus tribolii]MBW7981903.1 hypothetical protein [Enterobacillus tribolii]RDK90077.1 type 1 fimbria pilin [Enterobacillus tribolii]